MIPERHTNYHAMEQLNPVGKHKTSRRQEQDLRRTRQARSARTFLFDGDPTGNGELSAYRDEPWNREYNPRPYPEAVPDVETYAGTGIGFLYGFHQNWTEAEEFPGRHYILQLLGWTLVRTGVEERNIKPGLKKGDGWGRLLVDKARHE